MNMYQMVVSGESERGLERERERGGGEGSLYKKFIEKVHLDYAADFRIFCTVCSYTFAVPGFTVQGLY
jgi:hypothetical protein